MPVSNATIGGTGVAGGTWTIENTNTATVGRYHDLAFLLESNVSFTQARPGVLSGYANAGATVGAAFASIPTGSGLGIFVFPGSAVVERTSHAGPYVVDLTGTATVTLSTADATNPRIDRVDLQVLDGVLGDNSGTSLTQVVVTTGVAAGTPSVPAAPTNSTPICQVLLPAGTLTLTAGMITDTRKSAALRGTTRVLLPGDSVTDPGYAQGEMRDTSALLTQGTIDRWNSLTSAWETLDLVGIGAGFAKYTAAVTATGASQNLPASATTPLQLINPVRTCPDVSASGTNNTVFTLNRTGQWSIKGGVRIQMGATETIFYQVIRNSDGLIVAAGVDFGAISADVYDRTFCGEDYFTAGNTFSLVVILGSGTACTVNSGATGTGYRTWLSFKWLGP